VGYAAAASANSPPYVPQTRIGPPSYEAGGANTSVFRRTAGGVRTRYTGTPLRRIAWTRPNAWRRSPCCASIGITKDPAMNGYVIVRTGAASAGADASTTAATATTRMPMGRTRARTDETFRS